MPDPAAPYWTAKDIAEYWNIKTATVHTYRTRKWLPEPDHRIGNSPVWYPQTIIEFERPGQGARTDRPDRPPSPSGVPRPRRAREVPPRPHPPVVYYLRFSDRIKIGMSTNLGNRLVDLPYDELLGIESGGQDVERQRHREFAHLRVVGEWFQADAELMAHIDTLASGPDEISRLTSPTPDVSA